MLKFLINILFLWKREDHRLVRQPPHWGYAVGQSPLRSITSLVMTIPQKTTVHAPSATYTKTSGNGNRNSRFRTNAAHDLAQFSARFGRPLTYKLSKLAHCMQKPGDILRAFIFMLRAWDMAAPSTSDACAMTASGRGRTGTDDTQAESRVFCSHATYARARLIFDAPS